MSEIRRLYKTLKPFMGEMLPEVVTSYADSLGDIRSEAEMIALTNLAVRTHWPNLGWPSPAELRDLLINMRQQTSVDDHEPPPAYCSLCEGTKYRVVETHAGRIAIPCYCMSSEPRERVEEHLSQNTFHSAKVFALEERRKIVKSQR